MGAEIALGLSQAGNGLKKRNYKRRRVKLLILMKLE